MQINLHHYFENIVLSTSIAKSISLPYQIRHISSLLVYITNYISNYISGPCDRSYWLLYRSSIRYSGVEYPGMTTVESCLNACLTDPDCFSCDFDQRGDNSCWSHTFEQLSDTIHPWSGAHIPPDQVSHYTFQCNGRKYHLYCHSLINAVTNIYCIFMSVHVACFSCT